MPKHAFRSLGRSLCAYCSACVDEILKKNGGKTSKWLILGVLPNLKSHIGGGGGGGSKNVSGSVLGSLLME